MITMNVWKCSRCGTRNKVTDGIRLMIILPEDICTKCKKERTNEPTFKVRID